MKIDKKTGGLEINIKSLKGTLIGTTAGVGERVLLGSSVISKMYENIAEIFPKGTKFEAAFLKLSEYAHIAQQSLQSELNNPNTDYIMSQIYSSAPIILTGTAMGLIYDIFFNERNK